MFSFFLAILRIKSALRRAFSGGKRELFVKTPAVFVEMSVWEELSTILLPLCSKVFVVRRACLVCFSCYD
jgi:hypothetical protein